MPDLYGLLLDIDFDDKSSRANLEKAIKRLQKDLKVSVEVDGGQIENITTKYKSFDKQIQQTTKSIESSNTEAKNYNSSLNTMASSLANTIKQSIVFNSTVELMNASLRKLREGFDFIVEVEDQMTQVRAITGLTKDETDDLVQSYAALGAELGITTEELSGIAISLFRQGLEAEQVAERMRIIAQTARVTGETVESVTKTITAGINGAGIEAEKFSSLLVKAGSISATSFGEVSNAVNRVIGISKTAGLETELLISQVATLSESLRGLSSQTLGTSIRAIIARFSKVNEATGELNEDINDVQTAIESVGISFLDSEEQIRPVGDLLTELSSRWNSLDKNTKNYLATQIAGTRHISTFNTLMDNYNRVLDINNQLVNESGTLGEQYEIVQDSLTSSLNRLQVAFEQLYLNTLNSDALKTLVDFAAASVTFADNIGVLNIAVGVVTSAFLLSNKAFQTWTTTMITTQGLIGSFRTVMITLGNTFNQLIAGQITLRGAMTALGVSIDITKVKIIALQATITLGLTLAITGLISVITSLMNTNTEFAQQNELINSQLDEQIAKYEELTESQKKALKQRLLANKVIAEEQLPSLERSRDALQEEIDALQERIESGDTLVLRNYGKGVSETVDVSEQLAQKLLKLNTRQDEYNKKIEQHNKSIKDYNDLANMRNKVDEESTNVLDDLEGMERREPSDLRREEVQEQIVEETPIIVEKTQRVFEKQVDTMSILDAKIKDINSSLEKQQDVVSSISDEINMLDDTEENRLKRIKLINQQIEEQKRLEESIRDARQTLIQELGTVQSQLSEELGIDVGVASEEDLASAFNRIFSGQQTFGNEAEQEAFEQRLERVKQLMSDMETIQKEVVNATKSIDDANKDIFDSQKAINDIAKDTLDNIKDTLKQKAEELLTDGLGLEKRKEYSEFYENEIKRLQEINKEKQKEEDREKRLLDIQKARERLANVQQQRTVRLFTGERFEFVADPKAVMDAQEELDKLVENHRDKTSQEEFEATIQNLQNAKAANDEQIRQTEETLRQLETNIVQFLDKENNLFKNGGFELNRIVDDTFEELEETYGSGIDSIIDAVIPKVNELNNLFRSLQSTYLQIQALGGGSVQNTFTPPIIPDIQPQSNVSSTTSNNNSVNIENVNLQGINDADSFLDRMRQFSTTG